MKNILFLFMVFVLNTFCIQVLASDKVQADLKQLDRELNAIKVEFPSGTANPHSVDWVKRKIAHMVKLDQYIRIQGMNFPKVGNYTPEETQEFFIELSKRMLVIDADHTQNVRKLLTVYEWFWISTFGDQTDHDAWLLVQHADHDPVFQTQVLRILEKYYPLGETKPKNVAYLHDRVCASWHDPSKQKPQRYGTQGQCVAKGKWVPIPIEDPDNLDHRRKQMGLPLFSEYLPILQKYCE